MRALRLAALALVLAGCETVHRIPLGDLSLISNRNVPAEMLEVLERDVGEQLCEEVGPTNFAGVSLGAVVSETQRKVPGSDALANVELELILRTGYPGPRWCVHVRGDAVRFRTPPPR